MFLVAQNLSKSAVNIASENSTPNANGIRVCRFIGSQESKNKKVKNSTITFAKRGVFFGIVTKLSPVKKVYVGAGSFWNSSSAWTIACRCHPYD